MALMPLPMPQRERVSQNGITLSVKFSVRIPIKV
jgi:hypothetical protein